MVSPVRQLAQAFEQLKSWCPELQYYSGPVRDAVFDMYTADTLIAGIAMTVLAGRSVPHEHRQLLKKPFMRSDRLWLLADGSAFDLAPYPELLEFARRMERVRCEAAKASSARR
jgi:hypothetical protein